MKNFVSCPFNNKTAKIKQISVKITDKKSDNEKEKINEARTAPKAQEKAGFNP